MSVHVIVMPDAIPHHLRTEDSSRQVYYNDAPDLEYAFEVLASGALAVWKGRPGYDTGSSVEIVYGPSAWDNVQGTPKAGTM